jgi:hypothetical protein
MKFGLTEYRAPGALGEWVHLKDEFLLQRVELLAPSFDRYACGEKTTTKLNGLSAPILPFIDRITPGPNQDIGQSDKSATI